MFTRATDIPDAVIHKLSKAKTGLMLDHPFFGAVALNMRHEFTDDPQNPTACTNGKEVLYDVGFFAKLTQAEATFLVAHEAMHPMLEHHVRRGSRDPYKWNMAGDYVINHHLVAEGVGTMIEGGLYDADIYTNGEGYAERIYDLLPDGGEGGGGYGGNGEPLDQVMNGGQTPAEIAQAQADMKVMVAQAAQAARMVGKLSAGLARLVDTILQAKVDWRAVLERFLVKCKTDQRSFARFSRRFLPQGMYLPSISGESMGEIVVAVDCSGSIGDHEIAQFAAEIRRIKDDLMPVAIHVVYFDASVSHVETYTHDDELDIRPHGGGGTDFAPVMERIANEEWEPVAIVFLTDLYCSSYGHQPDVPVLWVSTDSAYSEPPFGEVVVM